jgi:hypothetical protein
MWKLGLRPRYFPEKEYINGIAVAVHARQQKRDRKYKEIIC